MPKLCLLILLIAIHICAAEAPTLSGMLSSANAVSELGNSGARLFRSAGEWSHFQHHLTALGWKSLDNPLARVDFTRNIVACVFQYGDEGNTFKIRDAASDGKSALVDVAMGYVIYKQRGQVVENWKFVCVAVPRAPIVKIRVFTYHPMNSGPNPSIDKAQLEWSAELNEDVVDNLQATIRCKAESLKPGDDIELEMTLNFLGAATEKDGQFAKPADAVRVWDGKYSNGYRNHAFLVTNPDGNTRLLRPKIKNEWGKNAPHLVEIKNGKPYILPEWFEGKTFKSLRDLGLETTKPGTYRITGIYTETPNTFGGKLEHAPWSGELFSNTVVVEVK